jgi:hypothetical protein
MKNKMKSDELNQARAASMARHAENRRLAIDSQIYVFDETAPETGLQGGQILAPTGQTVGRVFTSEEGWRDRVLALIDAANRGLGTFEAEHQEDEKGA